MQVASDRNADAAVGCAERPTIVVAWRVVASVITALIGGLSTALQEGPRSSLGFAVAVASVGLAGYAIAMVACGSFGAATSGEPR